MGIKNLNVIMSKYGCTTLFRSRQLSDYAGKTIAVDASVYMYKYKSMYGKGWMSVFLSFLHSLKDIKCVFVFDSKECIQEKIAERVKRSSRKRELQERVDAIERAYEEYKKTGSISDCLHQFLECKNVAMLTGTTGVSAHKIEEYLSKSRNQLLPIYSSDFELLKQTCQSMGMMTIDASVEAEKLCSLLCIEGKVDAVMTEDSDAYAYMAPCILNKVSSGKCLEISTKDILEKLELSPSQFIDVCILCGTDYSQSIQGIGPMKAYKYIKMYGSIEGIHKNLKLDISVLNHVRLREIFSQTSSGVTEIVFPKKKDETLKYLLK